MIHIDRRSLIKTAGLGLGALALPGGSAAIAQLIAARGFTHNVASGEPSQYSVLLWTRYVPAGDGGVRLRAELSDAEDFGRIAGGGEILTGAYRDWTAKLSVDGLAPGRPYFYRFIAPDGTISPIGRTRTLPEGAVDRYRMAVFSCANLPFGHFNAYAHAAARDDIDLTVHLGDYFYEYKRGTYPSDAEAMVGRLIDPVGETIALADYRLRFASYRADPDLQAIHRRHPMVALWDDHESANDSWEGGAQNHQPEEGDWATRRGASIQAYREWMPVSDEPWKSYDIGDLATLVRTESRLLGRTRVPDLAAVRASADPAAALAAFRDGAWMDPAASMFGSAQEAWIAHELRHSVKHARPWQIVGNGTIMGRTAMPAAAADWLAPDASDYSRAYVARGLAAARAGLPLSFDAWGGYPAARSRFLKAAQAAEANLIVLAGDSHNAWAYDLAEDGRPAGVELDGHSVTTPGYEDATRGIATDTIARGLIDANDELKWCRPAGRGYFTLELTPGAATSEWLFLDTIAARSTAIAATHRMMVRPGRRQLEPV